MPGPRQPDSYHSRFYLWCPDNLHNGFNGFFRGKQSDTIRRDDGLRLRALGQLDDARTEKLIKSSHLRPADNEQNYGKPGPQLVQTLREWLETTSDGELGALRHRIRAFFENIKERQLVA